MKPTPVSTLMTLDRDPPNRPRRQRVQRACLYQRVLWRLFAGKVLGGGVRLTPPHPRQGLEGVTGLQGFKEETGGDGGTHPFQEAAPEATVALGPTASVVQPSKLAMWPCSTASNKPNPTPTLAYVRHPSHGSFADVGCWQRKGLCDLWLHRKGHTAKGCGQFLLKTPNLEPFSLFFYSSVFKTTLSKVTSWKSSTHLLFTFLLRYNFVGTERSGGDSLPPA